ncbi:MAG TPA: tetratricopeptide repeat protein [Planctomycetota bacterium]|jgi:tetratricopeptide (TPR) repeat protein|nr:tetratricopeptide repeat protein [Planctomycetota bacterium]
MSNPSASEPPFEILILSAAPEQTPASGGGKPLRPERWLFVTHLLVLLSLAGLVVCIVGLVRLTRSSETAEGSVGRVSLMEAAAASVPAPANEASPRHPDPIEAILPALAPRPGAEGPAPAGSKPPAGPPAPIIEAAPEPVAAPEPEVVPIVASVPAPLPAAAEARVVTAEEAEVRKLLGEAKALEADPAEGLVRYRKVLDLSPGRTELWKTVADLELARGSSEEAAQAYREFLRSHPDRADALHNLAILELRAGRAAEARTCLEAAIKAAPSADLYYNLGNLHLKSQSLDAAISAYRRALEYEARHAEARFNLALALERSGRRAEAVSTLAQLSGVAPEIARERARMEASMGGLEATRALDLARASSDVETVLAVASGFRQAGELEKTLALLDRAVELAPKQASALLNRGAVRQAMGRQAEAAADYEAASALDPALPEARFNLGVLAEERSQYVAALNHYAAALKTNPSMACALNNVGALYLKVGQAEKSLEWFRRCRAADSGFTPARLNLAWAYLALGSKELALTELRGYTQDVPKDQRSPDAARVMAELEGPSAGGPGRQ